MALEITDKTIESIIKNRSLVIIDFWAAWCGPCKMMNPIIEALAEENGDILIGKVNTVDNNELTHHFRITSIPCILFIKDGVEVRRIVGVKPKSVLQGFINEFKN